MSRAPKAAPAPEDLPEPDRVTGAPHPRETLRLLGQEAAEAAFLAAFNSGRLHHGWLITGPRGSGKATLAWKLARFLLATPEDDGGMFAAPPPDRLDIPADHPVTRQIGNMRLADDRCHVMLAMRLEGDVTQDHDLVIAAYFGKGA